MTDPVTILKYGAVFLGLIFVLGIILLILYEGFVDITNKRKRM